MDVGVKVKQVSKQAATPSGHEQDRKPEPCRRRKKATSGVELVFPSVSFNTIINQMIFPNGLLTTLSGF